MSLTSFFLAICLISLSPLCGPLLILASTVECESSCTEWARTVLYCRWEYGDRFADSQEDYGLANDFVSCLCNGKQADGIELGKGTMSEFVGTCESCVDTPGIVKNDLLDMLTVCTVQDRNGTAELALSYRPQVYNTNVTDPQIAYY
ncbi:hypothetical protein IAR50_003545 [Cryptococcus sp. DSM 104548]